MSEINPTGPSSAVPRIGAHAPPAQAAERGAQRAGDSVEVSEAAALLARLHALPDTRADLVADVRKQLHEDTYDPTGAKYDQAFDTMLDDLNDLF